MSVGRVAVVASCWLVAFVPSVRAHSGPPFPIVYDRSIGPYVIAVWTDPDATIDGEAAGQFWVTIRPAAGLGLAPDTRVDVSIRPLDRDGPSLTKQALPVNRDLSRRFVALVMDHEGRFAVEAAITGSMGKAIAKAEVDATYDLRPSPMLIGVYLLPFLLAGFLWIKLLMARRSAAGTQRTRGSEPG